MGQSARRRRRNRRLSTGDIPRYGVTVPLAPSSEPVEPVRHLEDLDNWIGKWVAVKDKKVIAASDSSRGLVYELHKLGPAARGATTQFVPPPSSSFMVGVG